MKLGKTLQTIILTLLFSFATLSHSQPLSTKTRWIIDAKSGHRVKLTCANWPGHLHAMIAEGLHKRPLKDIVAKVSSMGFNCVRHTWATYMFTRANNANLTVAQSLDQWNLKEAAAGIAKNNPRFLNLTIIDAQKAVVDELGAQNIMVVLDNHVSLPQWCCGANDGNGFFGDKYFDPNEWLQGLTMVAKRYKGNPAVVAMSMRNELRGPGQNENDWYQYMQQGATAIHRENPDVLVIVSGLAFDTNLAFLKGRPFAVNLDNKLVYEAHWYSFGNPLEKWLFQTNEFCANRTQWFINQSGFLVGGANPVPLFLSEFGADQRGVNEADNRYLSCLMAFMAERDLDWALWTLQGSYMLREGQINMEEMYGMLDANWDQVRNSTMQQRLQLIKRITQDPFSSDTNYYIMYHPQSGHCVRVGKGIYASDCEDWSQWSHNGDGISQIKLMGTSLCLTAVGDGFPAIVSKDCSNQQSMWKIVSSSQLHIAAKDGHGRDLCLGWNSSNKTIMTEKCLCLGNDLKDVATCTENPERQWFKLIPTNKNVKYKPQVV